MYIALIVFEVILAAFAAWCILNEKKLLAFEERTEAKIRRRFKNRKRDRVAEYLCEERACSRAEACRQRGYRNHYKREEKIK